MIEKLKERRIYALSLLLGVLWTYMLVQALVLRSRLQLAESIAFSQRHGVLGNEARLMHAELEHLIIVCGHSVFRGTDLAAAMEAKDSWTLQPYQKDQLPMILEHLRIGVQLAAADARAALIFSGGQTSREAGPLSEAQSYWLVARANSWFGYNASSLEPRVFTEQYARDSFENLFFSICRFRELVGAYPARVTLVSFSFKQARFEQLHLAALRYPPSCFTFHGTQADGKAEWDASTRDAFKADPYGCLSAAQADGTPGNGPLAEKKFMRNPFLNHLPYPTGCPELGAVFDYCDTKLFAGPLPWDGQACA